MNVLDKIKTVQYGLQCHGEEYAMCRKCPYHDRDDCRREVMLEANEVINALKAELKKKTEKRAEVKPGFITLTTGIVAHSENLATWYDLCRIAVQVNDILTISDYDKYKGSMVQFKDSQQTTILVQETLEEILGKITDTKGEGE